MSDKKMTASSGYTSFLGALEPVTIALTHSAFRIDRLPYLQSQTDALRARFRAKVIGFEAEHFDVQTSLSLIITMPGRTKPLVRFTATYDLHFHGKNVSEKNIDRFVESDVRLIIWPYFRELVNNVSGRMHIPPIILPISDKSKPDKKALPISED